MGVSGRPLIRREREGKEEEEAEKETLQRKSYGERRVEKFETPREWEIGVRGKHTIPSHLRGVPSIFFLYLLCILNQTSATSPTISTVGAISKGVINIYGMLAGCRHSL